MLTVALNHARARRRPSDRVRTVPCGRRAGAGTGWRHLGGRQGEPLFVEATVRGVDGEPVADAQVDVWEADARWLLRRPAPGLPNAQGRQCSAPTRKGDCSSRA
jgi:hydroxyquinol 1,2-dioxygenase